MIRNQIIALVLSCLIVSGILFGICGILLLVGKSVSRGEVHHITHVEVRGPDQQTNDRLAAATRALRLPDVQVDSHVTTGTNLVQLLECIPIYAVSLFFMSGFVMIVFKRVCRWMKIEPIA